MALSFVYFAGISFGLWLIGLVFAFAGRKEADFFVAAGVALMGTYIAYSWISLERPPLRTLGETRVWYVFFLPLIGLLIYLRYRYKWFLSYSIFLSSVFLLVNILNPENFDKTLMPALQSPWFVPHVVVYMLGYALLAASSLISVYELYRIYFHKAGENYLALADHFVYIGFAFLTMGILFGAWWAKVAWGHYWTWDPKETWALITWMAYLLYIHYRYRHPREIIIPLWILALSFVVLLICWFGINYLPAGRNSVHVYNP